MPRRPFSRSPRFAVSGAKTAPYHELMSVRDKPIYVQPRIVSARPLAWERSRSQRSIETTTAPKLRIGRRLYVAARISACSALTQFVIRGSFCPADSESGGSRNGRRGGCAAAHVRRSIKPDGSWMIVEPVAGDRLEDNLKPVGRLYYGAATMVCVPTSLAQEVGVALSAQAGEAKLRDVIAAGGFRSVKRAAETPFNMILEARP